MKKACLIGCVHYPGPPETLCNVEIVPKCVYSRDLVLQSPSLAFVKAESLWRPVSCHSPDILSFHCVEFQVGPGSGCGTEQDQRIVLLIWGCLRGPAFVSGLLDERDVS